LPVSALPRLCLLALSPPVTSPSSTTASHCVFLPVASASARSLLRLGSSAYHLLTFVLTLYLILVLIQVLSAPSLVLSRRHCARVRVPRASLWLGGFFSLSLQRPDFNKVGGRLPKPLEITLLAGDPTGTSYRPSAPPCLKPSNRRDDDASTQHSTTRSRLAYGLESTRICCPAIAHVVVAASPAPFSSC
jgi:hypothetical protein